MMSSRKKKTKRYKQKTKPKYVVTVTTKDGKRISSDKMSRKRAERHLANTKKNWNYMYKNARVKKVQ